VSTIVKAAAVQISPVLYSRVGTVEKVVKKIRELGKQGVQFRDVPRDSGPVLPLFLLRAAALRHGQGASALLEESVTVPSAETQRDRGGREGGEHGRLDRRQRARTAALSTTLSFVRRGRHADPAPSQDHADL